MCRVPSTAWADARRRDAGAVGASSRSANKQMPARDISYFSDTLLGRQSMESAKANHDPSLGCMMECGGVVQPTKPK